MSLKRLERRKEIPYYVRMKLPAKILLITCGTISVALGVLGLFLPLLPTTPFLLLAAACYARSSEKLYDWLLGNRWFGEYIRNYREGKGIPLKRTAIAIALLWLTIGYTAIVAVSLLWVRLILLAIAGGVTVHLVSISTTVRSRRGLLPGSHHVPAKKTDSPVNKTPGDDATDWISEPGGASSASSSQTLRQDATHHSANTITDTPGDAIMSNLTSQDSDAVATLAAVERFNDAFNRHDVDAVMAAMTDDCVFENTSPFPDGTRIEGQSAVRAYWEKFFQGSPTARFYTEDVFASKDRCVVRWKYTKTKDGNPWHIRGVDVFRVRGGKISEKLSYVKN